MKKDFTIIGTIICTSAVICGVIFHNQSSKIDKPKPRVKPIAKCIPESDPIGIHKLSAQEVDRKKLEMFDMAEPIFRSGDISIAHDVCWPACQVPSNSLKPLVMSSRIADMAEIVIDRKAVGHGYVDSYLKASNSILLEEESESPAKTKLKQRIEKLSKAAFKMRMKPVVRSYKEKCLLDAQKQ